MRLIFLCHVPNVACVASLVAKLRSKNQSTVLIRRSTLFDLSPVGCKGFQMN